MKRYKYSCRIGAIPTGTVLRNVLESLQSRYPKMAFHSSNLVGETFGHITASSNTMREQHVAEAFVSGYLASRCDASERISGRLVS